MKWEYPLLILFVLVGIRTRRMTPRGWVALGLVVAGWIMYNWKFA